MSRDVLVRVTVPRRTPSGRELAPATGEATVRIPDPAAVEEVAGSELADTVTARTSVVVVAPDGEERRVEVELPLQAAGRWLEYGDTFAYTTASWVVAGEVVEEKLLVRDARGEVVGSRTYGYEVGS